MSDPRSEGMHPAWWTLIFVVATIGTIALTATLFSGSLRSSAPVTLISDRAGLVMDRGAIVYASDKANVDEGALNFMLAIDFGIDAVALAVLGENAARIAKIDSTH